MLIENALRDRQAKPGPFTDGLRRKKWLEQFFFNLF